MGLFDWFKNIFGGKKQEEERIPQFMQDTEAETITLTTADGEEVEFNIIAGINHNGGYYAILQPVELLDGMDDDEALVFRVSVARDGTDSFEIVTDDGIVDAVFAKYDQLLEEQ
ncbi:MAG: DUF1292 domain-containing protein [Clostridia bacterium]|nr:DUF1292 domain-containing protein [Clostridia bacterium]